MQNTHHQSLSNQLAFYTIVDIIVWAIIAFYMYTRIQCVQILHTYLYVSMCSWVLHMVPFWGGEGGLYLHINCKQAKVYINANVIH